MALKCGIVGLPNVGKSTLFNALTEGNALAANFPFATKDPNIGIIKVPDERLDKIASFVNPQQIIPTTVEIVDIAGLIKGASKGEGLGNQFLGNIREVDAILHVVRCFEDDNVVHVDGSVDPVRDKDIIESELVLKDLEAVEKRLEKAKKNAKTGDKSAAHVVQVVEKMYNHLGEGKLGIELHIEEIDQEIIDDLQLLTTKPMLYVCNVEDDGFEGNELSATFLSSLPENTTSIIISANLESELNDLDNDEERQLFMEELGLKERALYNLIRTSYNLLSLITYFTAGEKEVRAWTIPDGAKAPQAAGVIHTDFEKGFIRAEVISYDDFVNFGSENAAKDAGKMAVEGKEYVVKDGDVMHFRFNV